MLRVAIWSEELSLSRFRASLGFAPDVVLENAKTGPVDAGGADALLLAGGIDIDASWLRQPVPDPSQIEEPDPLRDEWDFTAARTAIERGIPILAVCRGHQVLNVALGGTLILHVDGHRMPSELGDVVQPLRHASGIPASRMYQLVNSTHHQAIDRLGDGLEVEAWCADDGIVEQVRLRKHPWCVGVQFHPERSPVYRPLFESFVEAIRKRS